MENGSDILSMSKKELSRLQIVQQASAHKLAYRVAAERLGLKSERQVKRLVKAYRTAGPAGLISKKRGHPSHHQLDPVVKQQALELLQTRYAGFRPTHAFEKLTEQHHLPLSAETVRHLMIEADLHHPRRVRRPVIHQLRTRRSRFGELVQLDGSPYDWFEGRAAPCSLLVYIDDATGRFLELWLTEAESTFSYFEATEHYLQRYGKPLAFYSDKFGVFRVNQPRHQAEGVTQFGRAMQELDIELICANSPQAKGRVEKANQTLQGRLPQELRLRGISTVAEANVFLASYREELNQRFAVEPARSEDAHRPLRPQDDLARILTIREERTLSKNLTLQYDNVLYQIQTARPSYALRQAKVMVCQDRQGRITILYRGRPLAYTVFQPAPRQGTIVPSKEIDAALTKRTTHRAKSKAHVPPADHPWRQSVINHKSDAPPSSR